METYFHGNSEIQGGDGGLQTLFLMNPNCFQYHHDTPPPQKPQHSNHVFIDSSAAANPSYVPPHQQFVGIPLPKSSTSTGPSQEPTDSSGLHGLIPRFHYNFHNDIDHHAPNPRDTPRAQRGLSLTLSSHQQPSYGPQQGEAASRGSASSGSGLTNGVLGLQGVLLSSKYLKAAQELFDEVVNVNVNGITSDSLSKKSNGTTKVVGESSASGSGEGSGGGEVGEKNGAELTTAERQEIQMKKAKLASMLDEAEQRYRQYHHQMQIVISSFEQSAGIGSAKTYTALALQTISKQFRCLKDAIKGHIRAANRSLGEEDSFTGRIEGSRLKFVDHHLRRQQALQQLEMIQPNAWRPQRGLPERSVSVLRAWLFEHFLHPYPKDSDKQMLAKQAGLTRGQVSNWFINARVRLWKPMVEEMYLEEIKERDQHGGSDVKTSKSEGNEDSESKSTAQQEKSSATVNQTVSLKSKDNSTNQNALCAISMSTSLSSPVGGNVRNQSGFSFIGSTELDGIAQGSPKKPRTSEMIQSPTSVPQLNMDAKTGDETNNEQSMKFGNERRGRDEYLFMGGQSNFIGGLGEYSIGEIGRFDAEQFTPRFSGNGVSLTLGLPHCENLSLSATHQPFLPSQNIQLGRRADMGEPNEFGAIDSSTPHSTTCEDMEMQNRKRFIAQLLPDFVA